MDDLKKQRSKRKTGHELEKSDWDLGFFESQQDLEIMLYFYDHFDSEELILTGLRTQDIAALSSFSHKMVDITTSIDQAFRRYVSEKSKSAKTKWTEVIGGMLGLYMLKTKTYSKLNSATLAENEMKHFIVLRYKNKKNEIASLRPFSLVSTTKFLSPDQVKREARKVITRDEAINASYFNFNTVSKL